MTAKKRIASKEAEQVLGSYAPEIQNLALAARDFVLEMIPDISQMVDVKARIIGFGYSEHYADQVCMLMPTKAGVNLGIAYAIELPDPKKLLEGTGKLHRHVKLKSESDLGNPALKNLLKAALARRARLKLTPKK
jgi:Domain of unknown function (DU1801)